MRVTSIVLFFLLILPLCSGAEQLSVTVLPITVRQDGAYAYLNPTIRQMIITRLAGRPGISIAEPLSPDAEERVRTLLGNGAFSDAAQLANVDWLVEGSMYSLKDGIQVNLGFYSAKPDVRPVTYGLRADSADEVIPAITKMIAEVSADLEAVSASVTEEPVTADRDQQITGFQTPHPEREYKKGLFGGSTLFGEDDDRFDSRGVRRSSKLPLTIESMALGDLDGDGVNELVAASRTRLVVFEFAERRFNQIASFDLSPRYKIHVINIADPGDTGRARIFVSANKGKLPASFVLAYGGGDTMEVLHRDVRAYIRPITLPKKGVILAGQQYSPNLSDSFLTPGVHEISIGEADGEVTWGEKLVLPNEVNLFDFVMADLNGDNSVETMVIDSQSKLLVYDEVLNLIWVSSASYGASKDYFGPAQSKSDRLDPDALDPTLSAMQRYIFIPSRMDVKDITGDGLPEVVVSTNEMDLSRYLVNLRSFDGGAVACLGWRGNGLFELWRTNKINGYVADYAFDGDAALVDDNPELMLSRLYVAQQPDSNFWDSFIPSRNDSILLAYEMVVTRDSADRRGSN
jgi:hypothetical protein